MKNIGIRKLILYSLCCLHQAVAQGAVIVQAEIQLGVSIDQTYFRLFDDIAPLTVNNFMGYVNNNQYKDTFFHHSEQNNNYVGLLIQSGRYTFDPLLNDRSFSYDSVNDAFNGGLQPVLEGAPIVNEFFKSNTRGTLTVALVRNDPDSATNAWSINLADNLSLDTQNGGFTVFGEVMFDAMSIFDSVGVKPVFDRSTIHPELGLLPLIGYSTGEIQQENLARINNITGVFSISTSYVPVAGIIGASSEVEDVDFGIVVAGNSITANIVFQNLRSTPLVFDGVANSDMLFAPYTISNGCTALNSLNDSCTIAVSFSPQAESLFTESFNVSFNGLFDYIIAINGEGSLSAPVADIDVSPIELDFGEIILYDPANGQGESKFISISNTGRADLNITSFSISGDNASEFEYSENCIANNPRKPGQSCDLQIYFRPFSTGDKTASMTIVSDDPDESTFNISLSGAGSLDNDGIPTLVEDMGPNGGDGNNDNVKDSEQSHVLTFVNAKGHYITIVVEQGQYFNNFDILTESDIVNQPADVSIINAFKFRLDNIPIVFGGAIVEIGIILPATVIPEKFYIYGSTPDNTAPHWYEFLFDGLTGAQIFKNVNLPSPTNTIINRNLVKLLFVDSLRGDTDNAFNGRITTQIGMVDTEVQASSDSGSTNLIYMIFVVLILAFMRRDFHMIARVKYNQ